MGASLSIGMAMGAALGAAVGVVPHNIGVGALGLVFSGAERKGKRDP